MTLSKCVTNSFSGALRTLAGSFTTSVLGWICSRMCVVVMYDMSNGGSWRSSTTSSVDRSSISGAPRVKWLPFSRRSFIGWARAITLRSRKISSGGV